MEEFEVIFYDHPNGSEPAKEFILSLDNKMKAKMLRTIKLLQTNGYELRESYSKHLDEGIFELRAKVGNDISRVLILSIILDTIFSSFFKSSHHLPLLIVSSAQNQRRKSAVG